MKIGEDKTFTLSQFGFFSYTTARCFSHQQSQHKLKHAHLTLTTTTITTTENTITVYRQRKHIKAILHSNCLAQVSTLTLFKLYFQTSVVSTIQLCQNLLWWEWPYKMKEAILFSILLLFLFKRKLCEVHKNFRSF